MQKSDRLASNGWILTNQVIRSFTSGSMYGLFTYIYIVDFYGKCRFVYHTSILWKYQTSGFTKQVSQTSLLHEPAPKAARLHRWWLLAIGPTSNNVEESARGGYSSLVYFDHLRSEKKTAKTGTIKLTNLWIRYDTVQNLADA